MAAAFPVLGIVLVLVLVGALGEVFVELAFFDVPVDLAAVLLGEPAAEVVLVLPEIKAAMAGPGKV